MLPDVPLNIYVLSVRVHSQSVGAIFMAKVDPLQPDPCLPSPNLGSPVSVVKAEIVMQNIEEEALATYSETLPLWLRYVDVTITVVHENKIDEFHEHLKEQNTNIQFTKEIEENGKIPFLDCLVTSKNNTL